MKVGDKVVYVGGVFHSHLDSRFVSNGYVLPDPKETYTVRDIHTLGGREFILLVEIINPPSEYSGGKESGYNIKTFRKIDTRPELSELTDEMILTAPTVKELQTA